MANLTITLSPEQYARVLSLVPADKAAAFCITAIDEAIARRRTVTAQKQEEPKRGAGRPMSSETGAKLKWRSVGLEPALWDWVSEAAASSNMTANEFLRQLVMKAQTG